jgi:porphobilinogen deaminase
MRGNLDTRLRKLAEGQADAIVLALAGLVRLGLVELDWPGLDRADRLKAGLRTQDRLKAALRTEDGLKAGLQAEERPIRGPAFGRSLISSGIAEPAVEVLPFDVMLPAPGQGALAIELRADSARATDLVAPINHPDVAAAVAAERALLEALGGGCSLPLGAYAELAGDTLRLRAILLSPDGSAARRADRTGPASDPAALAEAAAADLRRA